MMLTTQKRIEHHLAQVPSETIFGAGIHHFLSREKTESDYREMVKEIQDQIKVAPAEMKSLLGKNYPFFKNLRVL